MARKTTDTAEAIQQAVETTDTAGSAAEAKQGEKTEINKSGFYCYIGPNMKHLIQTGKVYRGTRAEVLAGLAGVIKAQPLVKSLIVSGDQLPEARIKVKTPGNALYASYQELAKKGGK